MTEAEGTWADELDGPVQKKRAIPTWVWIGCGAGCLFAIVVAGLIVFAVISIRDQMNDPDFAWNKIEEVVRIEQRPEGWTAHGTDMFGFQGTYFLEPEEGTAIVFQTFSDASGIDQMFDPESFMSNLVGEGQEAGTIDLQGHTVRCMRFFLAESEEGVQGPSIRIDLEREEKPFVTIQITVPHDELTDERVAALLEPFELWPE